MNKRQVLVFSRLKDDTTLTQQWNSIKNYHLFCVMPKYVSVLLLSITVNSRLADTSLLRTPRYYGQQQNPRRKLQTFD